MRNIPSTKAIMVNISVVNGPLKGPRIKFSISISMLLRKSSPVIFLTNSQRGLVQSCGFLNITSISCAIAHKGSLQAKSCPLAGGPCGPFFIQLAVLFSDHKLVLHTLRGHLNGLWPCNTVSRILPRFSSSQGHFRRLEN